MGGVCPSFSNLTFFTAQLQIEEQTRKLRTGDLGIPPNPENRSECRIVGGSSECFISLIFLQLFRRSLVPCCWELGGLDECILIVVLIGPAILLQPRIWD